MSYPSACLLGHLTKRIVFNIAKRRINVLPWSRLTFKLIVLVNQVNTAYIAYCICFGFSVQQFRQASLEVVSTAQCESGSAMDLRFCITFFASRWISRRGGMKHYVLCIIEARKQFKQSLTSDFPFETQVAGMVGLRVKLSLCKFSKIINNKYKTMEIN